MKCVSVRVLFLVLGALCVAQAQSAKRAESTPDLNGTWALDKSGSNLGPGIKAQFVDVTLVIVQSESELRMTKKAAQIGKETAEEVVYTLGSKSDVEKNQSARFIAVWDGRKLMARKLIELKGVMLGGRPARTAMVEVWELSKDGKKLIQKVTGTPLPGMPAPPRPVFVYTRAS